MKIMALSLNSSTSTDVNEFSYPESSVENGRIVMKVRTVRKNDRLVPSREFETSSPLFPTMASDVSSFMDRDSMDLVQQALSFKFGSAGQRQDSELLTRLENVRMHPYWLMFDDPDIEAKYIIHIQEAMSNAIKSALKWIFIIAMLFTGYNVLSGEWVFVVCNVVFLVCVLFLLGMTVKNESFKSRYGFVWAASYFLSSIIFIIVYTMGQNVTIPEYLTLTCALFHDLIRYRIANSLPILLTITTLEAISLSLYCDWWQWGRIMFCVISFQLNSALYELYLEKTDRLMFLNSSKIKLMGDMYLREKEKVKQILYSIYPRCIASSMQAMPKGNYVTEGMYWEKCVCLAINYESSHLDEPGLIHHMMDPMERIIAHFIKSHNIQLVKRLGPYNIAICEQDQVVQDPVGNVMNALSKLYFDLERGGCGDLIDQKLQIILTYGSLHAGFVGYKNQNVELYGLGIEHIFKLILKRPPCGTYFESSFRENISEEDHPGLSFDIVIGGTVESKNWHRLDIRSVNTSKYCRKINTHGRKRMSSNFGMQRHQSTVDGVNQLRDEFDDLEVMEEIEAIHNSDKLNKQLKPTRSYLAVLIVHIISFGCFACHAIRNTEGSSLGHQYFYVLRFGILLPLSIQILLYFLFSSPQFLQRTSEQRIHTMLAHGIPLAYCTFSWLALVALKDDILKHCDENEVAFLLFEGFGCIVSLSAGPSIDEKTFKKAAIVWSMSWGYIFFNLAPALRIYDSAGRAIMVMTKCIMPMIILKLGTKNKEKTVQAVTRSKLEKEKKTHKREEQRKQMEDIILSAIPENVYLSLKSGDVLSRVNAEDCIFIMVQITLQEEELPARVDYSEFIKDKHYLLTSLGMTHGVDLIKSIGQLFVFASGYRQYNPATLRSALKFSVEVAQLLDRWHLSWSSDATSRFRIAVDKGPVQYGFTRAPLVSFDVWGDAGKTGDCFSVAMTFGAGYSHSVGSRIDCCKML
eukprot:TRINITY_DN3994_c0_g1_i5.p1 TRINITY_DN3994_c0_g1~~TRINITY_DN3994_c0_g1_i5.p1  ORF type:complete len:973 (+),score=150.21 TRINITY_DN3994_c0_g1_i5:88-3006(+)